MIDKSAKIFVAGHKGMVGSAIVRVLHNQGFNNLVLKSHDELNLIRQTDVEVFFEDEKPEYVFLAAAKVGGIFANINFPADFLYDNLAIQNNIIYSSYKFGVKKLLFLGSSCIYPRLAKQPMKEEYLLDGKLEPTNEGYAIAKISGLKLCEYFYKQYKCNFVSVMPCNIFGYNDDFISSNSHVIPSLIRKIHNAKINKLESIEIWGTGKARRELLFADDLADACMFVMNNYNNSNFLNVGVGTDFSITEIVEMLCNIIGFCGKIVYDTSKPDGMPQKVLDVSKISSIGWKYKTNINDALKLTYQWYIDNVYNKNLDVEKLYE